MEKQDQIYFTPFLEKQCGLSICDIDIQIRYTIDDQGIHFVKNDLYSLIGNPDNTYETSTDNEYFFIHDNLFDRILETDQNSDIVLNIINKYVSLSPINENGID